MKVMTSVEFSLWGTTNEARRKLVWNNSIGQQASELLDSLKPATSIDPIEGFDCCDTSVEDAVTYDFYIQNCVAPAVLTEICNRITENDQRLNPNKKHIDKLTVRTPNTRLAQAIAKYTESSYVLRGIEGQSICRIVGDRHFCDTSLYLTQAPNKFEWIAITDEDALSYQVNCEVVFARS